MSTARTATVAAAVVMGFLSKKLNKVRRMT
jgi:hypothetical protein